LKKIASTRRGLCFLQVLRRSASEYLNWQNEVGARIVDLSGEFVGQRKRRSGCQNSTKPTSSAFRLDASVFAILPRPQKSLPRLRVALAFAQTQRRSQPCFHPFHPALGKASIRRARSAKPASCFHFNRWANRYLMRRWRSPCLTVSGVASNQRLQSSLEILRREVRSCLAKRDAIPGIATTARSCLLRNDSHCVRVARFGRPIRPKSQKHARQPASASLPMTGSQQHQLGGRNVAPAFPLRKPIPPPRAHGGSGRRQTICVCRRRNAVKLAEETTRMSRDLFFAWFLQRTRFVVAAYHVAGRSNCSSKTIHVIAVPAIENKTSVTASSSD